MSYLDNNKNNISSFIESQMPWFMRTQFDFTDDGTKTKILKFMEYYYQWLEKEYDLTIDEYGEYGIDSFKNIKINQVENEKFNLFNALNRLQDYTDIDAVPFKYLRNLRQQIMPDVPEEIEGDVRRTMKLIRDFNTRKGTVKAFEFMFRALFNKKVDVIHNEDKILTLSGANWEKPIKLRAKLISTTNVVETDLSSILGYHLRGESSGAYARIASIDSYYLKGIRVHEFVLDKNDISGRFVDDEYLEAIYIQPQEEISVQNIKVGEIYRIHTVGDSDFTKIGATENTVGYAFRAIKIPTSGTGIVISEEDVDYSGEVTAPIYRTDTTEQIRLQCVTGVKEVFFRVPGSGHTYDDLLVISNNGSPTNVSVMETGTGYSAGTFGTVNTAGGTGTGLTITVTVSAGAIVTGTVATSGTGYADNEIVILNDNIKLFNAQTGVNLTTNVITLTSHGFSDNDVVRYLIGTGSNSISKTFNANSGVNIETDRISLLDHGFYTTEKVVYTKGAGAAPAGLTTTETYYIIRVDKDTLQLATTYSTAAAGTNIDITAVGANENNTLVRSDSFTNGDIAIGGLTSGNDYYIDLIDTNTFRLAASSGGSAIDLTSYGADVNHSLTGTSGGSGATLKITGVDNTGGASARITELTKGKVDDVLVADGGTGYKINEKFVFMGSYLEVTDRSDTNFSEGEYIVGEESNTIARIRAIVGNKFYIDDIRGNFYSDRNRSDKFDGETIIRYKTSAGVTTEVATGSFVVGTSYRISKGGAHQSQSYSTDFTAVGAEDSNAGTIFTATATGTASGNTAINFGSAHPRTIQARVRWFIGADSNFGTGVITSLKSTIVLPSNPGTITIGTYVQQQITAGIVARGTVMSQTGGTTLTISRNRLSKLVNEFIAEPNDFDFIANSEQLYTYDLAGNATGVGIPSSVVNGEIEDVEVVYGGSGFEEAPHVWFETTSGAGANLTPFGSEIGGIAKAIVVSPGINYGKNSTAATQEKTEPWVTAKGSVRTEPMIEFDGKYIDNRGFLSNDNVLQDGRFFEPWSYVVGSDVQFEKWVAPISTIAHPVGTKIFPTYYVNEKISGAASGYIKVDQATS